MKKTIAGIILLSMMLGLLMLFPLIPEFMGNDNHSVEVNRVIITPPFLKEEPAQAVLLYFGYVGCTAVCIPALNELAPMYDRLHAKFPSLSFYFINLNPAQSSEWAKTFAKSFHPDFHGAYTTAAEMQQLERDFNLAVTSNNQEIGHSSNLYLIIKKNGHYTNRRIYTTHPYDEDQVEHDLQRLLV
jgi:protein SCO1/2